MKVALSGQLFYFCLQKTGKVPRNRFYCAGDTIFESIEKKGFYYGFVQELSADR